MMRDGETDREDSPQRNATAENHGHLRAGRSQEALRSAQKLVLESPKSSGCPGIHFVDQASLELTEIYLPLPSEC